MSYSSPYISAKDVLVDVSVSATISEALQTGERVPVAVVTPATFTSTALTFQASHDGGVTYAPVYKEDGNAYSVTVSTSRHTKLDSSYFYGATHIKVVCGTTEGADRTLVVCLRRIHGSIG